MLGLRAITLKAGGFTVNAAVVVTPAYAAERVTAEEVATAVVFAMKVALLAPAATVTVAGTVAIAVFPLDSETTTPPAGAMPVSLTVPVEGFDPTTEVGFKVIALSVGGVTVRVAEPVVAPPFAEIAAVDTLVTAFVVTVNVADVVPAATVTDAGVVATATLLLASVTTRPPVGAAALTSPSHSSSRLRSGRRCQDNLSVLPG